MPSYKNTINKLISKRISVSLAESCTGGQLSKLFTDFPGISKIFHLVMITYSNESKLKVLNISKEKLKKYGAVSKEIAETMCSNLYKISGSKLCISTTGIAGPSGGSKLKPVGLVFIGIKYKNKVITVKNNFKGNRKKIQLDTIKKVLIEINKLI